MPKRPPNTPSQGDRVRLRGKDPVRRQRQGLLKRHRTSTNWCWVVWDDAGGPRICHLFEIECALEGTES